MSKNYRQNGNLRKTYKPCETMGTFVVSIETRGNAFVSSESLYNPLKPKRTWGQTWNFPTTWEGLGP